MSDEKTRYPHRYGADHRPPCYGCIPSGVYYSTFPHPVFRHGEVQFERELTLAECLAYELIPIPATVPSRGDLFVSGGYICVVLAADDRGMRYANVATPDLSDWVDWATFNADSDASHDFSTPEPLPPVAE